LGLLASGRVEVDKLITHRFSIDEAQKAVDLLLEAGKSLKSVIVF
jgi:threonine dehydrogenase-like Zn-dependent dehydrogenase